MTQTAGKDLFIKVDGVPWVLASLLDKSKEVYVITKKSIRQSGKSLIALNRSRFGKVSAIVYDESLRSYYIFLGDIHDTDSS